MNKKIITAVAIILVLVMAFPAAGFCAKESYYEAISKEFEYTVNYADAYRAGAKVEPDDVFDVFGKNMKAFADFEADKLNAYINEGPIKTVKQYTEKGASILVAATEHLKREIKQDLDHNQVVLDAAGAVISKAFTEGFSSVSKEEVTDVLDKAEAKIKEDINDVKSGIDYIKNLPIEEIGKKIDADIIEGLNDTEALINALEDDCVDQWDIMEDIGKPVDDAIEHAAEEVYDYFVGETDEKGTVITKGALAYLKEDISGDIQETKDIVGMLFDAGEKLFKGEFDAASALYKSAGDKIVEEFEGDIDESEKYVDAVFGAFDAVKSWWHHGNFGDRQ